MAEKSSVLLGLADEEIRETHVTSCFLNKIGGQADFTDGLAGSARCSLCGTSQRLVIQIYCPLDGSKYHRTLYVFCCDKPNCWSESAGWTVFRQSLLEESNEAVHSNSPPFANTGWDNDEDNWDLEDHSKPSSAGTDRNSGSNWEAVPEESNNRNLQKPPHVIFHSLPRNFLHAHRPSFRSYFINVFDESECISNVPTTELMSIDKAMASSVDDEMSMFASKCRISMEPYESASYGDKTLHKFLKCMKVVPEQVMRYCLHGSPILPKKVDIHPTPCSCGSKRVYEAQLMPALLPYLKSRDSAVEFSTVLIYTCSKNCASDSKYSLANEFVLYVDDPDMPYFKGQKNTATPKPDG